MEQFVRRNRKRMLVIAAVAVVTLLASVAVSFAATAKTSTLKTTGGIDWTPSMDCSQCHADAVAARNKPGNLCSAHKDFACTDCHEASILEEIHATGVVKTGREATKAFCLGCHSTDPNASNSISATGTDTSVEHDWDGLLMTPHNMSARGLEVHYSADLPETNCSECHYGHTDSDYYCYNCHKQATARPGWIIHESFSYDKGWYYPEGIATPTVDPTPVATDTTVPTVTSDAKTSYVASATVKLTATDETDGSGVAYLYYNVDGGSDVSVAPGDAAATAAARLGVLKQSLLKLSGFAPDIDLGTQTRPHADMGACTACHTITGKKAIPAGSTPPHAAFGTCTDCHVISDAGSGTGTDIGAVTADVHVTGAGSHTIVFWAVDKAGNVAEKKTVSFTITKVATTLSIGSDHSSVTRNHSIVLSGIVKPDVANGTSIVVMVKKPGSSKYVKLSTRKTFSSHHWSYTYKLSSKGSYYFKAQYAGSATFGASTSKTIKVSSK